jgi:YVTN family beta-propeller protein
MTELDGSVWVTNYADGTVVRVDGTTNQVAQTIAVGLQPCGIAVANGMLWV